MPSFVWKGKNRFGAFQEGILIADTRDAATAILRRQNVQLTSIKEKGRELRLMPKFSRGVGAKRVAIFTRQFSVMLDAGGSGAQRTSRRRRSTTRQPRATRR